MGLGKVVILDGTGSDDKDLEPALEVLTNLAERKANQVQTFTLRDAELGRCIGCFGCWLETPGICIQQNDVTDVARAIIRSDVTVLFTPVTFGGYSSELRRMADRFIQFTLPYFGRYHGETHHLSRYAQFPRLVVVGVQRQPDRDEAGVFKGIVGRNAINFHAPSHAADVVLSTDDSVTLRARLQSLLDRADPLPLGSTLKDLTPTTVAAPGDVGVSRGSRRALLIVGSPKIKSPSTSGNLGGWLMNRLKESGWKTETLTLKANICQESGQAELRSSVDAADLVILSFPLYIDALPFLVTKALEVVAAHRQGTPAPRPQRLMVLCNSGFPEPYQNAVALAICHQFATQTGMTWAGFLAMGGGGGLGGEDLTTTSYPGAKPVVRALDLTATALAEGRSVPQEAVDMMARSPIPLVPLPIWFWLYGRVADQRMRRQAVQNGVSRSELLARPHAA